MFISKVKVYLERTRTNLGDEKKKKKKTRKKKKEKKKKEK